MAIGSAIAPEFELEVARGIEDLDAIISIINDVDVLAVVYRDANRRQKLTITRAAAAEREFEVARRVKNLDAIVAAISHI